MDKVFIQGLQVATVIGVYDWEKTAEQPLIIDIECATDTQRAAMTDDLQYTVDYGAMAEWVRHHCQQSRVELLETLAEQLANGILTQFSITKVTIRINKPQAVANVTAVGIEITREAQD